MTRRRTRILGIVAAGALALTACAGQEGTDGDSPAPGTDAATDTESDGDTDATDDETDAEAPAASGGVITVAETNQFNSFNPSETNANMDINSKVVGMTRSDFIYLDNELNIVPDESFGTYEMVSEDPLQVKYTVNESSVWSDGNAVDKGDMLLAWAVQSGHFNGEPNEEGAPDPSFFAYAGSTEGLGLTDLPEFEDDRTMTLTYSEPYVDWEISYSLAMPPAHVVAERAGMTEEELVTLLESATPGEANEQLTALAEVWNTDFTVEQMPSGEDENLLVSSGPMIVSEFVPEQSITLVRNENYGGDLAAQVDEITVRFIGDAAAAISALRNGEVDVIAPQPSTDTIQQLEALDGVTVLQGDQLSYDHIDLRMDAGAFADENVRRAFLMTVPRQQIVDRLVVPVNPEAEVLNSQIYVISEGDLYEAAVAENGSEEYAEVDIEGARELLAGATPTVRILYNNENPNRVDAFSMIQASAQEAGFVVEDAGMGVGWGGELANPDNDASIFGWISSGVGSAGVPQLFSSTGGGNYNGYNNPEVDALATELMTELDPDAAEGIKRQIDTHLFADAYGLPLFQSSGLIAHNDNIGGIEYMPNQTGVWWNFWEWTVNS